MNMIITNIKDRSLRAEHGTALLEMFADNLQANAIVSKPVSLPKSAGGTDDRMHPLSAILRFANAALAVL